MVGKIFITRTGYDPQLGKHVKDPYLGPCPTLGACRPDVRKQLGKRKNVSARDQTAIRALGYASRLRRSYVLERTPNCLRRRLLPLLRGLVSQTDYLK